MDRAEFFAGARGDVPGPLHGLRVLDVTKVWSGPQATAVLADLGADVVRVELPGGRDGEVPPRIPGTRLSWFRETVNRNKRSVGLDLRTGPGRAAFLELVAAADLVVENYKPGTLAGWHVGYQDCRQVRPDVVMVSVSGWGQYGPAAHRPAYDPVVQAAAGWMSLNGPPDGPPVRAATFLADELAALHAAIAALAALAWRDRTGEGQHVDVALYDALVAGSSGLLTLAATGAPPRRWGNQTDFVAPSDVYACRDGHLYLAVALDKHWRSLAELVGRPELARAPGYATNQERLDNREAVGGLVAGWAAEQDLAGAMAALSARGLVAAPVRTMAEVAADPHTAARELLQDTELSDGSVAPIVGPAAKFGRTPTRVRRGAPAAGADTAEVRADWGDTKRHTT